MHVPYAFGVHFFFWLSYKGMGAPVGAPLRKRCYSVGSVLMDGSGNSIDPCRHMISKNSSGRKTSHPQIHAFGRIDVDIA